MKDDTQKKNIREFYNEFNFNSMIEDSPIEMKTYRDRESEFLKNYFSDSHSILEIGCGYGRILKILSNKFKQVVGIDFCENQIKKAKKYLNSYDNVTLIQMDAQELHFENNSFDNVCCMYQTLGNMPGIERKVIDEMVRVCKPGGEILVSVFSEDIVEAQYQNYTRLNLKNMRDTGNAIVTDEGFYSRRFSKQDLMNLFEGYPILIEPLTKYAWLVKCKKQN